MRDRAWVFVLVLAAALPAYPQDSNTSDDQPTGWRKFGASAPASEANEPDAAPDAGLIVPAGTWISVRVNEPLSSDRSQPGDTFTATLAQPLVANGRVISRRGQTVAGVVVEAHKAGAVKGTSSLGLELTEIGLADGRQLPVKTRVIDRRGETSVGRDAEAIGTTTAVGAAVGAAADGGFGAGVGAAAGAAASTIGVLVTRGRATVVYPEMMLTFRLDNPITIDENSALEAFQPVRQEDYETSGGHRQGSAPPRPGYFGGRYPPYVYPQVVIFAGPRYGRRYYRGW